MRFLLTICIAFVCCTPFANAMRLQTATKSAGNVGSAKDMAQQGHDIVVVGTPDGPFPVTVNAKDYVELRLAGQEAAADAHAFSRCVKPFDNGSLHELIDGQPDREIRAAALNRIIRGYMACYPGYGGPISRDYGTCNARNTRDPNLQLCRSFYDRGALVEMALKTYAPDLAFTTQQIFDPPVLARFHEREDQFDKTRSKGEIVYAEIAACIVALHPKSALALLHSELASTAEGRLRALLLGTSPKCLGGAQRVTVDPSQFRIFIADAIYSWAVAMKGTGSLIPYKKGSSFLP